MLPQTADAPARQRACWRAVRPTCLTCLDDLQATDQLVRLTTPDNDRARVLLDKYAGLDLHQLRHSAATHLGEAEVPLQLIMGKTRHKNPRTAMRYVKPGAEAISQGHRSPGTPPPYPLISDFSQMGRDTAPFRLYLVWPPGCGR
ncbi:tyrosine-type recombinase/integrase [Nonomuraea sp. NPDC003707]